VDGYIGMGENKKIDASMPITYADEDRVVAINIDRGDGDIWATVRNIADIFGVTRQNIEYHISNIYNDHELDKDLTSKDYLLSQRAGNHWIKKSVAHYNLDVILTVGYRVNSKKAGNFRRWATEILSSYLTDGYALNKKALSESPEKLNKLAAEIRELRFSEQSIYKSVRDCFKIASSDYAVNDVSKKFYSTLQDKLHYAVTGMTASKLKEDRVQSSAKNAGVINFKGEIPTIAEAKVGKNLLNKTEIYRLHMLSETFLIFAEMMADREIKMTMAGLEKKVDELLRFNEYPVFSTYEDFDSSKTAADRHVEREHADYLEILRLQMLDWSLEPFSLDSFYNGEYAHLKEETSKITLPMLKKNIDEVIEKLLSSNKKILLD